MAYMKSARVAATDSRISARLEVQAAAQLQYLTAATAA